MLCLCASEVSLARASVLNRKEVLGHGYCLVPGEGHQKPVLHTMLVTFIYIEIA
jgi:hypothetical protein